MKICFDTHKDRLAGTKADRGARESENCLEEEECGAKYVLCDRVLS